MTENGYFQLKPETKEKNQKKIIHLHENVQDFLHNFLKDPPKDKPSNKKKPDWGFLKKDDKCRLKVPSGKRVRWAALLFSGICTFDLFSING
jgi:hypothetical protein